MQLCFKLCRVGVWYGYLHTYVWFVTAFQVILIDLKTLSVHVFVTIGQHLNDTQAAVVDHTSRTFSTVPQIICQSLVFIGEKATYAVHCLALIIIDFLTQLIVAPANVIFTAFLMLSKVIDIPYNLWEAFQDIPRPGKAGLVVVAVIWIIYLKVNFASISRRSWNLVKSAWRSILKMSAIVKNCKRILQQLANSGGDLDTVSGVSDTKALCVICQDNTVSFISIPCKHVCLCYTCVKALVNLDNRCPLCRGAVSKFERVYIPL